MVECDARGRVTERSWMYRLPAPKGGGVSWEKKQKLATPGFGKWDGPWAQGKEVSGGDEGGRYELCFVF